MIRPPFLTPHTVKGLLDIHAAALMDVCVPVESKVIGKDTHNQPVVAWIDGQAMACKFRFLSSKEIAASAVNAIAELRLKPTDSLDPKNRIRILQLFGTPLPSPNLFEIASGGMVDYVSNVYQLSLVNDGTP